MLNHMCKDMEQVHDVKRVPDRIRQDVSRSPGGDSRLYLLRDGVLEQISTDHTLPVSRPLCRSLISATKPDVDSVISYSPVWRSMYASAL